MAIADTSNDVHKIRDSGVTHKIRDYLPTEDFTFVAIPQSTAVGGSSSTLTISDVSVNQTVGAMVTTWVNLTLNVPLLHSDGGNFLSSNHAVATIDANGIVTPISTGTSIISAFVANLGGKSYNLTVTVNGGGVNNVLLNFVTGSLGKNLADAIHTNIVGLTAPTIPDNYTSLPIAWNAGYNIFSSDHTTRNSGLWCGATPTGITALGTIPANQNIWPYSYGFGATLISRRDAIIARHISINTQGASYNIPFDVTFRKTDGTSITATATKICSDPSTDFSILTFPTDVDASIEVMKILPANFRSYMPQPAYGYPCVFRTQDDVFSIGDVIVTDVSVGYSTFGKSTDTYRKNWYQIPRSGDSSSPIMHLINGELVLLATLSNGYSTGSGPTLADCISKINTCMTANGSPYQVTTFDLSAFNSY